MGLFLRFLDDYFDEAAIEIANNGGNDSGEYDDNSFATDPNNPIWDGSEIHYNPYGVDPSVPDPNEVSQD